MRATTIVPFIGVDRCAAYISDKYIFLKNLNPDPTI